MVRRIPRVSGDSYVEVTPYVTTVLAKNSDRPFYFV